MFDSIISFIDRYNSFILTTHDTSDADGIGSELVLAYILKQKGKDVRIINSSSVPKTLTFMQTPDITIEKWNKVTKKYTPILDNFAMIVLDTCEEFHLGAIRTIIKKVKEVFIIDHHEIKPSSKLRGFVDSSASSTSELAIELACFLNIELDKHTAMAAYTGISYDTGFFSYPKTSIRTFRTAIKTLEWGASPNYVYKQLMESSTCAALLLQKLALRSLKFYADRRVAMMILRTEDFEKAQAEFEEVENIVNIPLKAKEIEVTILLRQKPTEEIFCSLRSKGMVNVSKIAQEFGGGGHVTAAGFRSTDSFETISKELLACIESRIDIPDDSSFIEKI